MTATPDQDDIRGRVRLHPTAPKRLASGHLWIYDTDIAEVSGTPHIGDIVDVTHAGRLVGRGLFNPQSKIRVRLLTSDATAIDPAFWTGRLTGAIALRKRIVRDTTAYRLIHGESDGLPGLVVDRYAAVLVMQTLSAGMAARKARLATELCELTGAGAVYLRNDAKALHREGVETETRFLVGNGPTEVEIRENGARFHVDVAQGQKTGWYCDQRENRAAVGGWVRDLDVVDVCCHTGAFAVHGARGGARSVTGLDVSADALKQARAHAALNGVDLRCVFEEADAFDGLRAMQRAGRRFDVAILDPPAFARAKAAVPHALTGYKDLNLRALSVLRPGGLLVSCSCSHYVSPAQLLDVIVAAARDAHRQVRLLETRGAARDHPVLPSMPETSYLKCFLLHVL